MAKGRVKWFNDSKGFGFIEREGANSGASGAGYAFKTLPPSADEIFVHYTSILGEGHKTLAVGQEVEFDIYDGPKGRIAQNVTSRS